MADATKKTRRKPQGPRTVYVVITGPEGVEAKDIEVHYAGGNAKEVLGHMKALGDAGKNPSYSEVTMAAKNADSDD